MHRNRNEKLPLTKKDRDHMAGLGISEEQLLSQVQMFEKGAPYVKLDRPATAGDGIRSLPEEEGRELIELFEGQGRRRGPTKFVPASGAATRMFRTLLHFNNEYNEITRARIVEKAEGGDKEALEVLHFIDGIRDFAFFDSLRSLLAERGVDTDERIKEGDFKDIFDCLLSEEGLGYADLPKGLLNFHRYTRETRTAFEEQLVEAAEYARDDRGLCRLHFTVSPEHRKGFEELLKDVQKTYERKCGVRFQVDFSLQASSTNTVAVDLDNNLFRTDDGSLLFRPGGHGALLENLNSIQSPLIFIKNIDNVVPDRLKDETYFWKKVLGGYLLRIQERVFAYLEGLQEGKAEEGFLQEVEGFVRKELCLLPPSDYGSYGVGTRREYLEQKLNRPIRICGMVRNVGEPGGGPFWAEADDGSQSLQIVEKVQVDPDSEEQQSILKSSTHFNPVDIVCGVTDRSGNKFDLTRFVDREAVFISRKSKDGRDLKALELPGLWNGSMADWNTVFVEVPLITFNPVKTINDLLREEHKAQPTGW